MIYSETVNNVKHTLEHSVTLTVLICRKAILPKILDIWDSNFLGWKCDINHQAQQLNLNCILLLQSKPGFERTGASQW